VFKETFPPLSKARLICRDDLLKHIVQEQIVVTGQGKFAGMKYLLIDHSGRRVVGAIDRAEDAPLGFVGDAIKKVGLFTIQFRQR
jgi:hypothetical protein